MDILHNEAGSNHINARVWYAGLAVTISVSSHVQIQTLDQGIFFFIPFPGQWFYCVNTAPGNNHFFRSCMALVYEQKDYR